MQALTKAAVELTQETEPKWEYTVPRFLYMKFEKVKNRIGEKRELKVSTKIQYLQKEDYMELYF